jgi:hypothetical protein
MIIFKTNNLPAGGIPHLKFSSADENWYDLLGECHVSITPRTHPVELNE